MIYILLIYYFSFLGCVYKSYEMSRLGFSDDQVVSMFVLGLIPGANLAAFIFPLKWIPGKPKTEIDSPTQIRFEYQPPATNLKVQWNTIIKNNRKFKKPKIGKTK